MSLPPTENTPSGPSLDFARDKSGLVPLAKGDRKNRD